MISETGNRSLITRSLGRQRKLSCPTSIDFPVVIGTAIPGWQTRSPHCYNSQPLMALTMWITSPCSLSRAPLDQPHDTRRKVQSLLTRVQVNDLEPASRLSFVRSFLCLDQSEAKLSLVVIQVHGFFSLISQSRLSEPRIIHSHVVKSERVMQIYASSTWILVLWRQTLWCIHSPHAVSVLRCFMHEYSDHRWVLDLGVGKSVARASGAVTGLKEEQQRVDSDSSENLSTMGLCYGGVSYLVPP